MSNVLGLPALDEREALRNLIDALRIAEDAAKQLAFYRQQVEWIQIHHLLGRAKSVVTNLAVAKLQ